MLNPIQEKEDGDSWPQFKGSDKEIVAQVRHELAIEQGEIIEIDSEESGDEDEGPTHLEIMKMCQEMESLCLRHRPPGNSLDLTQQLRRFCVHLRQEMTRNAMQATLDRWMGMGALRQSHYVTYLELHISHNAWEKGPSQLYSLWKSVL